MLADRQDCVEHKPRRGVCPRRCRWEGNEAAARRPSAASEKGWRSPELGFGEARLSNVDACAGRRECAGKGLIHTASSSCKARRPLDRQRSGRTGPLRCRVADETTRLKRLGGDLLRLDGSTGKIKTDCWPVEKHAKQRSSGKETEIHECVSERPANARKLWSRIIHDPPNSSAWAGWCKMDGWCGASARIMHSSCSRTDFSLNLQQQGSGLMRAGQLGWDEL